MNLRGEPRSTAPMIEVPVRKQVVVEPKVMPKKTAEESTVVIKKKPVPVAKPPTPPKEPRAPKPIAAPRLAPTRPKLTPPPAVSSSTMKVVPTKPRPVTAPTTKQPTATSLAQSRSQRLVPIVLPSTTKTRPKPTTSTNRRSSFGATITSLTSNLERQSTSTGGSTSSLSSTNTQGSNPPAHSERPTISSSSSTILRSVSNDVLPSPNSLHPPSKSRIPVRTIPVAMTKKSST